MVYIDYTGYNSVETYHVEYHLDTIGSAVNSANLVGILGTDVGNSNCFIAHKLYIQ
jgi:hypothetical protein